MRVFRTTYRDRDGRTRTASKWYVEARDHIATVRRFPAFTDKGKSETWGRQFEKLVSAKQSGEPLKADLIEWLAAQPSKTLRRFAALHLIEGRFAANQQPLSARLEDFRTHLKAKGTTEQQIGQVIARVKRIFDSCKPKCIWWRDIDPESVSRVLVDLQAQVNGISKQTAHAYLQAVQEFCIWAVGGRKKVHLSPLADLEVKVKKTDATRVRRALTLAEVVKLLVVTRHSTREANGSAGLRHADTDQRHARKGPGGGQYTVRG